MKTENTTSNNNWQFFKSKAKNTESKDSNKTQSQTSIPGKDSYISTKTVPQVIVSSRKQNSKSNIFVDIIAFPFRIVFAGFKFMANFVAGLFGAKSESGLHSDAKSYTGFQGAQSKSYIPSNSELGSSKTKEPITNSTRPQSSTDYNTALSQTKEQKLNTQITNIEKDLFKDIKHKSSLSKSDLVDADITDLEQSILQQLKEISSA